MAAAGVKWVRVFPEWNRIEPSSGTWNWSELDAMLSAADDCHVNLSGLLLYNVPWINPNPHTFPTNNFSAWSIYVSNVVAHAAGRVRYWEVWNEPESFAAGGTPADYARLVTNAWRAAKAAHPNAQIGLSVASVDVLYLEKAIQAGAADHFDYICVHPYELLGTLDSGQEVLYLSIVPTIRKMLAARNPARQDVPIWFTELGEELTERVTPERQAQVLVKAYTMGIAQGVSRIQWFEAQEGGYRMGLLDSNFKPTPGYSALKNLAANLGPKPVYRGWLHMDHRDYAFLFQGASTTVLVAWAPRNRTDRVVLGSNSQILDPLTGSLTTAEDFPLTDSPVLVLGVSSNLVSQAELNRSQPFPWPETPLDASSISATLGGTNSEHGLHQLRADATSTAVTVDGGPARDCGEASGVSFTVDPNFLSYTTVPIKITAVVRRNAANQNGGFNLKYESTSGRKSIGWNSVPGNDRWYTLSWTIADDEFVGSWGFHFSFDSDSKGNSQYLLQQVTLTKMGD